jgi:Protein of unknown function (DUF1353)
MKSVLPVAAALCLGLALGGCAGSKRPAPQELGFETQGDGTGLNFRLMRDYRIEGRRVGLVVSDWLYCYPPTGDVLLVPRGYMTDFASIPDAVRPLIDVFGDNAEAAVAHDWLYAIGEPGKREAADDLFRFALKEQGVGVVTRNAMHAGVRVGGGGAYGRKGEWDKRFGDPVKGQPLTASPYQRRSTAIVAHLAKCSQMEDAATLASLRAAHASARWPRP